jgi:hypothetical protein
MLLPSHLDHIRVEQVLGQLWGSHQVEQWVKKGHFLPRQGTNKMSDAAEILFDIAAEHRYRRGYLHAMNHLLAALEPSLSLEQSNTLKFWMTNVLSPWAHKVRGPESPPQLPLL